MVEVSLKSLVMAIQAMRRWELELRKEIDDKSEDPDPLTQDFHLVLELSLGELKDAYQRGWKSNSNMPSLSIIDP